MENLKTVKTEVNQSNLKNTSEDKPYFSKVSIKTLVADTDLQSIIAKKVDVPPVVTIQEVKKPYEDKDNKNAPTLQKIRAVAGTSFADMVEVPFTLVNEKLDGEYAIHKQFRLVDYTFSLDANMAGRSFTGYSATGLKLLVTHIEEVKGDTNA